MENYTYKTFARSVIHFRKHCGIIWYLHIRYGSVWSESNLSRIVKLPWTIRCDLAVGSWSGKFNLPSHLLLIPRSVGQVGLPEARIVHEWHRVSSQRKLCKNGPTYLSGEDPGSHFSNLYSAQHHSLSEPPYHAWSDGDSDSSGLSQSTQPHTNRTEQEPGLSRIPLSEQFYVIRECR